jgi:hypothetical protein
MALILNRRIFDALAEVTGFYGDEEHKPQREFLDAFFEGWGRLVHTVHYNPGLKSGL